MAIPFSTSVFEKLMTYKIMKSAISYSYHNNKHSKMKKGNNWLTCYCVIYTSVNTSLKYKMHNREYRTITYLSRNKYWRVGHLVMSIHPKCTNDNPCN